MYIDYEDYILAMQEASFDDCTRCKYAGVDACNNQCMTVTEHYNSYLLRFTEKQEGGRCHDWKH